MLGNTIEFQGAVIFVNFEEQFQKGDDAYLLLKRTKLFHNVWETCDVLVVSVDSTFELSDMPTAKGV
jgi:hypothetical protein